MPCASVHQMRHLVIFLSIALLGNAGAAVSGLYTYEINSDNASVTITDYPTTETGALVIVDTLGEYPVTSIGSSAFYDCSSLTSITIPDSVTSIGSSAFQSCFSLTSIIIPISVTSIGDAAFQNCSSLGSVTIPDSVTSLGQGAFAYCTNLVSILLEPMAAPTIEASTFDGISGAYIQYPFGATGYAASYGGVWTQEAAYPTFGLYSYSVNPDNVSVTITGYPTNATGAIEIPAIIDGRSVTIIGGTAFWNCTGLTSIIIPDSVTSIIEGFMSGAFLGCTGLTSITIGNSVTSIGTSAFSYCSNLASITIPDSVTSIGDGAFSGCTGLTSITIGNSVTSIGYGAFSGCTGLASATMGNSVTSIGSSAFYDCTSLTSITIPSSSVDYLDSFAPLENLTFIFVDSIVDALKNDPDFIAAVAQAMLAAENNSGFATKEELPLVEQAGIDQVLADPASYELATSAEVASSFTAGQDDVLSDPASYDLYDEASIMEVNVATPLLSMTNVENQAEIEFAIESSDDLQTWTVNERILRTVEGQGDKYFVRVTAGAPYINPDVLVYAHPTLGDILTNAEGYVLYGFTFNSAGQDPAYTGSSWNFVAATATPEPDAGVTATLAGATFGNVSGGPWLTVNGLPAYTYPLDTAPYQANGHGSGDVWFTLNPDGSLNTP